MLISECSGKVVRKILLRGSSSIGRGREVVGRAETLFPVNLMGLSIYFNLYE